MRAGAEGMPGRGIMCPSTMATRTCQGPGGEVQHCRAQKTRDLDVAEIGEMRRGQVWLIWGHGWPC